MKRTLSVEGMMCQNCVRHVKNALEGVSGVETVSVSLEGKTAAVTAAESVTDEALKAAVTDAGYTVTAVAHEG